MRWIETNYYQEGDLVTVGKNIFISLKNHNSDVNNRPGHEDYWYLVNPPEEKKKRNRGRN